MPGEITPSDEILQVIDEQPILSDEDDGGGYADEYEDRDLTELDTFSKSYVSALASITSEIILFT